MNFTENEISMMREHTSQIVGFLKTLMPNVRKSIEFVFCTDKYGGTPHTISLSSKSITGRIGYSNIKLEGSLHSSYNGRDVYSSPDYMSMLIYHWPTIKARITSEFSRQQELVSSINHFVL